MESETVQINFRRPKETEITSGSTDSVFVTFYTPRLEKPGKKVPNHFWLAMQPKTSLYEMIVGVLEVVKYDLGTSKKVVVNFGWPMSSWLDRLSVSTMVYNLTRLPKKFPEFSFNIKFTPKS